MLSFYSLTNAEGTVLGSLYTATRFVAQFRFCRIRNKSIIRCKAMSALTFSTPMADITNKENCMSQSVFKQSKSRSCNSSTKSSGADNTTFGDGSSVSSPLSTKDLCIFEDGTNSVETTFPLDSIENAQDDASLSAAHAMLFEMQKRQETIYKLEQELLESRKYIEQCRNENEELKHSHITQIKNKHVETTALLQGKEQEFESKLDDIRVAHEKDIQSKDEEIARLHRVLEEKDRKIQRCVETREMLKQRHAEMISQISNAHDAQLEKQSNLHRSLMEENDIAHEKKLAEEIERCENAAAFTLSKELAKSMAKNMEQMALLDSEWKKRENNLQEEMKKIKIFANQELEGEILSMEALHTSTLEMQKVKSMELIQQARIDSVKEYRLNLKKRLAASNYPNACSCCTITFGAFDRKTHCRSCGLLICSSCSSEKRCTLCRRRDDNAQ